jgi:hypothetical protein
MAALWVRIILILCGIFDGVVGTAFAIAPAPLFRAFNVTPPNHYGYVQFPALLLIIFAVIFFRSAADPIHRRDQILYGVALKASYSGLVFWYQIHGGVPSLWTPWAWTDAVCMILLLLAWKATAPRQSSKS